MTDSALATPTPAGEEPTETPRVNEEIIVLDYGGQYSQLIARRVRDCGVFSELLPSHVPLAEIEQRKPRGIILSGGPA
jgi:GMP synthase (glutamine-hydrolysing)